MSDTTVQVRLLELERRAWSFNQRIEALEKKEKLAAPVPAPRTEGAPVPDRIKKYAPGDEGLGKAVLVKYSYEVRAYMLNIEGPAMHWQWFAGDFPTVNEAMQHARKVKRDLFRGEGDVDIAVNVECKETWVRTFPA